MSLRQRTFAEKDLMLVESGNGLARHEPPLGMGETVRFVDGGPQMIVVDLNGPSRVTTSWRDEHGLVKEIELATILCVRSPPA